MKYNLRIECIFYERFYIWLRFWKCSHSCRISMLLNMNYFCIINWKYCDTIQGKHLKLTKGHFRFKVGDLKSPENQLKVMLALGKVDVNLGLAAIKITHSCDRKPYKIVGFYTDRASNSLGSSFRWHQQDFHSESTMYHLQAAICILCVSHPLQFYKQTMN